MQKHYANKIVIIITCVNLDLVTQITFLCDANRLNVRIRCSRFRLETLLHN